MAGRHLLVLGFLCFTFAATARADKPAKPKPKKPAPTAEEPVIEKQKAVAKQFGDFKMYLLRTRQRLEKGTAEDREITGLLKNFGARMDKVALETEFAWQINFIKKHSLDNPNNALKALDRSVKVTEELWKLSAILAEDRKAAQLRREGEKVAEFARQVAKLIAVQKDVLAKTENGKLLLKELRSGQGEILRQTRQLARQIGAKSEATRKRLENAVSDQVQAETALAQKKVNQALQKQRQTIKSLEEAGKEIDKFLKQKCAVIIVYVLKLLEQRCAKIREMQKSVRAATIALAMAVAKNKDKKPNRANREQAAKLAKKQRAIVVEITELILAVAANGSSEAFMEVLRQVRTDIEEVQRLLERDKFDQPVQEIEKDIVEMMDDMIKLLKEEQVKKKPKGITVPELEKLKPHKTITELRERLGKIVAGQREISELLKPSPGPLKFYEKELEILKDK
jgi:hypothetical protein